MSYDAFIINEQQSDSTYYALMHKDKESVEKERKALRVWMRSVMKNQNLSAYEWATKAETSPTNITRFLKDSKYLPSSKTIAKLSNACGSHPHYNLKAPGTTRTLEVLDMHGNRLRYVNVYDVHGKVLAFEMQNLTGYGLGGIQMGDIVLVQDQVKPEHNDVICFRTNFKINKHGKIKFNESYPQQLMIGQVVGEYVTFKSTLLTNPNFNLKLTDVDYVGVVIQSIKSFKKV
tara:strand:+ start:2430 stop:3125 length:696 start_codon:yes stop_codon:yes gene_type:complete